MNQERFWELLSLKLSGEAQSSDLAELELFLFKNPEEGLRADLMIAIWNSKQPVEKQKKDSFNRHMQRLSNHLSDPVLQYENPVFPDETYPEKNIPRLQRRRTFLWVAGIAATLFIAVLIIINPGNNKIKNKATAQNTVSTKRGSKSKIVLPDGSQVWLNADSRIIYNEKFQGSLREVELSGEAFFDVVRDESRPFIIHTAAIDLKVLGTAFNVRSYAEEKNTETSLIRGSVEITLLKSPDRNKIILKPNEKLIVTNDGSEYLKDGRSPKAQIPVLTLGKIKYENKDTVARETLWTKNTLAFNGEMLEEIALKIERWYDVKVNILDEKLKKETYTGTFIDESMAEVMEALHKGNFNYTINKKEVIISAIK